ncbi:hypothetical protein AB6A23_15340 [Paenibacillus tarimensis]
MNAGYLSVWIILVTIILLATGWRRQLTGDVAPAVLIAAGVGWLILRPFSIPFLSHTQIELAMIWVICWSVVPIFRNGNRLMTIYLLFGAAMIGMLWFWMRRLYIVDPVFIVIHPLWDGPLIAGLFAGWMAVRFQDQLFLLTLAIFLGEFLLQYSLHLRLPAFGLGGAEWWDRFLLTLCTARVSGACNVLISKWTTRFRLDGYQDRGGQSS